MMMQIPKIAKGGIPDFDNWFMAGERKCKKDLFFDKYYEIYKRTKKKRIKKKQEKKSWKLKLQKCILACKIIDSIDVNNIKVCINGRVIEKEVS